MKKSIILLFTLLLSLNVHASDKASAESVERLMELTEVPKMMDAMHAQMTTIFSGMSKQLELTEEQQPAFDKYMRKLANLLQEEMSWDKLRSPMIEIYANRFTEEEIQGLITFYESDIGQSTVKKMPLIMQDSAAISQQLMMNFIPKVKQLAQEMQNDLASSKQVAG
ncbi:DUF2059 domain-containing protein [Neiella sp. HB171785]|uniref:DUF2059 domain-containing protein n=1 Tax=Neiella litorisoli TaxID=2771431 RepID=A0A8J6UHX2_9GAMM|nr:DUF2059 domain-containing protein [Neiella litorisoli]MBD1387828.1 DUF2059 domain-containing protein [Neiella litorisoli]